MHAPTTIRRTGLRAVAVGLIGMLALTFSSGRASAFPSACSPHGDGNDAARAYVCYLYDLALHQPFEGEVAYWIDVVNTQGRGYATSTLLSSPESVKSFVDRAYGAFLLRLGDPAGDRFWSDQILGGARYETLEAGLAGSDEAYGQFSGGTNEGYVTYLYQAVLHRSPSAEEVTYWSGPLNDGSISRGGLASLFVLSPESTALQVALAYGQYLDRAPDAEGGAYWASVVESKGVLHMLESLIATDESYGRITGP
ncbi:MAG: hypothetical protein QOE63_765 [Acidimicrobiaceae bacterium]